MDIHEEPEVGTAEKVMRIGCGALLGLVVGFAVVIKLALTSFGYVAAIVTAAVCVCAFLALRQGDRFWYSVFGRR